MTLVDCETEKMRCATVRQRTSISTSQSDVRSRDFDIPGELQAILMCRANELI